MRRLLAIALISSALGSYPFPGASQEIEAGRKSLCLAGLKTEMPGKVSQERPKELGRNTITLLECPAPQHKCQCGSRFTCCPSNEKCVCNRGADPQCAQ